MMQTLEELHLDKNTLFIFTSDNGGDRSADNRPLRGYKSSTWEGGMRVPTIARWPGQIPAGTICDEVASTMDFLPTFAKLGGAEVPADRIIDGKDMSALLLGKSGAKSEYDAFYYRLDAVRAGEWKYFGDGRLYDLRADIGETEDVAQQNPKVAARLRRLLEQGKKDLSTNCRPVGKAEGPLQFLIPRPGTKGAEAHSRVHLLESEPE